MTRFSPEYPQLLLMDINKTCSKARGIQVLGLRLSPQVGRGRTFSGLEFYAQLGEYGLSHRAAFRGLTMVVELGLLYHRVGTQ